MRKSLLGCDFWISVHWRLFAVRFQSRAVVRRWVSGQRRQPIQWLTLKVHVLKNGSGLRVLKDLTDVAQLVLVNPIDPKAVWLRAFFEKQGNLELYERSPDFSPKETPPAYGMGTALELPDWSGHRSHHSRMPNDQWLAYCRSNLSKLRAHPGFAERRRQQGIVVEFAL